MCMIKAGRGSAFAMPEPSDIKGKLFQPRVAVTADGTVYFSDGENSSRKAKYIQYGPDGRRVGTKEFGLDSIKECWYAVPNSPLRAIRCGP